MGGGEDGGRRAARSESNVRHGANALWRNPTVVRAASLWMSVCGRAHLAYVEEVERGCVEYAPKEAAEVIEHQARGDRPIVVCIEGTHEVGRPEV